MKYLLILVLLLSGIIQADSTTIQLHISADALMIRMPSNHWFVLVEDSVPHYDSRPKRPQGFGFDGTGNRYDEYGKIIPPDPPRIPVSYTRRLRFESTDSIPETDNSIIDVNWTGVDYGYSLRNDSNIWSPAGLIVTPADSTKEKDR